MSAATTGAELIVFAVPSSSTRAVAGETKLKENQLVLSTAKGLEKGTDLRMTELLGKIFSGFEIATLSGMSNTRCPLTISRRSLVAGS